MGSNCFITLQRYECHVSYKKLFLREYFTSLGAPCFDSTKHENFNMTKTKIQITLLGKPKLFAFFFAVLFFSLCPERESNPHALTDTWPSTMPVYQFQHLGDAIDKVTWLGLEPRTLSLKVRCSNQLSYQVMCPLKGGQR